MQNNSYDITPNKTNHASFDHTTFGGIIYQSDFYTEYKRKNNHKGSTIAQRIISDRRFDDFCRQNIERQGDNYDK